MVKEPTTSRRSRVLRTNKLVGFVYCFVIAKLVESLCRRCTDMPGVRVALFAAAATLLAIVDISIAESTRQSLQCKNIARDVIINSCKGPRMKRSPNLARLSQEAPTAIETGDFIRYFYECAKLALTETKNFQLTLEINPYSAEQRYIVVEYTSEKCRRRHIVVRESVCA